MSAIQSIHERGRRPVAALLCGLTVVAVGACGGGAGTGQVAKADTLDPNADLSAQSLVVSNWSGYMPKDLPQTFQKAVGPSVKVTEHATNEEIVAKLTAGTDSGIDVAFVSGQFAQALGAQGLLEPIHADLIPNSANLAPEATQLAYDKGNRYSIPYTWGTTGICYRADLVKPAPTSWKDLLEPKDSYKGKVTMLGTERWLMLPAQKSLGFSANTQDAGQMQQVKDVLVKTKPSLLAYDDTTFYERLISGEAVMAEAWDGWCNYGTTENKQIKFVVPSEGSDLWADTMVVLKTSRNKEAAHAFINYVLDAKNHAWAVENILYNVPNTKAMEEVSPTLIQKYPPLQVSPAQLLKGESLVDLGEAAPLYTRLATEITASKG